MVGPRVSRLVFAVAVTACLAACTGSGPQPSPALTRLAPSVMPRATPPPDFPVGSYTTTITPDDLRAGGITEEGLLTENSGMFILTYDPDGSWTMVQTSPDGSPINNPVFRGRYLVTGDRIRHDVEFPASYAAEGAHDEVTWRLEGNSLHLELAAAGDEIIRAIYGAHPWTRQ